MSGRFQLNDDSTVPSIRFVTRKWAPAMGGMETYCHRLTEELSKTHIVETLALPGQVGGAAPTAMSLLGFGFQTAFKLLFAKSVEVAHFGDIAVWPLALIVRLRHPQTSLAISAHGTDVSYPMRGGFLGGLYGVYLKLGARLLPGIKVIANSQATADATRSYGYRRLDIVSLATDQQMVSEKKIAGQHLLFAGRLVERKGLAWFVKHVMPLLPSDMRLRVAGTVWDRQEEKVLSDPRIDFLGRLSPEELRDEYAGALCVIVPNINVGNSEFEGFGLVAPEGAAAGGVVVAAYHSGLKEAVIDGVTGFHVPPGDAIEWQKCINVIAGWSAKERSYFIAQSVAKTGEHYSWKRVAKETLAAY